MKLSGFDDVNDKREEPFQQILNEVSGPFEDYLHTSGHRNQKREILDLHFLIDMNKYYSIHFCGAL